jgi:ABC-2 type transport system permease protein
MRGGTLHEATRAARTTPSRGSLRRVAALARGEAVLLRRNPSALVTALLGPVAYLLVPFLNSSGLGSGNAALVVTGMAAFGLAFVVYFNLVTALVARREDFVLKRLRSGELGDAEILFGTAAPAIAIAWAQIAIGTVVAIALFGMSIPTNPVLVVSALVLGSAVCVLFAAATTALTTTVEMAQLTATPMLVGSSVLSGVMFPVDALPEPVQWIAQGLPITAMVDLLRLGLTGTTADGTSVGWAGSFVSAAVPVLILTAWVAAGVLAARRWFRWEPRR